MKGLEQSNGQSFKKSHPLLFNILLMVLTGCALLWLSLLGLDLWTEHGKYKIVPDMKGYTYAQAVEALHAAGLQPELSDSIYDDKSGPGVVLEQSPKPNTKVKPNRTIYLTINAFSPKVISLPSLVDMSLRQARSTLEGLGIRHIQERYVPSEYKDLVLAAKFNGVTLEPGARIPTTATITLEIGEGLVNPNDSIAAAEAAQDDAQASEIDIN